MRLQLTGTNNILNTASRQTGTIGNSLVHGKTKIFLMCCYNNNVNATFHAKYNQDRYSRSLHLLCRVPLCAYTQTHLFSFPRLSLQSEAGRFECSVSDLRWVCKEQVSFKYRLCSWEDHMERMESIEYMPAGPLIDITVIAGKLFEVYLPHWICIGKLTWRR